MQTKGEIQIAVGIIVEPAHEGATPRRLEQNTRIGENILLESCGIGPVRCFANLGRRFTGGADGVFIHPVAAFSPHIGTGIIAPEHATAPPLELCETDSGRKRYNARQHEYFVRCFHDSFRLRTVIQKPLLRKYLERKVI